MATVRARDGRLYIDYYDEAGKRHRKALHLRNNRDNKKKAEAEKKKIEYELEAGVHVEKIKREKKRSMTLGQGFEEFRQIKKENEKTTLVHYKNAFDTVKCFEDKPIKSIRIDMIEMQEKQLLLNGLSKNSIASYFSKLRNMFDYFISCEYINSNPIPMRKMKPKKIVTVPEKEMLEILEKLKYKNRKHYQVIFFLLATGLRRSELVNLYWKDIDLKKNIIAVRNAKDKDRIDYLPIYPELREFILEEFLEREGKIFDYKRGDSLRFFDRFLKKENFNHYSLHTLRKTYISKLVNAGLSVFDVMALARHRKIDTTLKHYTNMELERMGREISEHANMGTLLGTKNKKALKLVKLG